MHGKRMHARYRNYTASEVEQNPMVPPTWIVGLLHYTIRLASYTSNTRNKAHVLLFISHELASSPESSILINRPSLEKWAGSRV